MSEELIQAAKAAAELEPAVEAFAEATGSLEPVREATGWLTDLIRYKRLPHQAKMLMRAAEKVKETGLPTHAVSDKLLRSILEDGPLDDDESMQERWANLLVNAATADEGCIPIAYPKILSEMEPKEALLLDRLWEKTPNPAEEIFETVGYETTHDLVDIPALYNLSRLGVLRLVRSIQTNFGGEASEGALAGVELTELGWEFVKACNPPS